MQTKSTSAFCHIEKTGGTTIIKLLRSRLGISHVDLIPFKNNSQLAGPKDLNYAKLVNPWVRSVAGHSIRPCDPQWEKVDVRWSALLRDPSERYVSDYFHFTRHMSFPKDFDLWLLWRARHNFQAQSLVGQNPIQLAIDKYERGELLLGTLPRINEFANALLCNCGIHEDEAVVELGVTNIGKQSKSQSQDYLERYACQIRENNAIDWQLYSTVLGFEETRVAINGTKIRHETPIVKDRTTANKLWRNVVYKPATLQNPLQTHGLKDYKMFASWSEGQWRDHISAITT